MGTVVAVNQRLHALISNLDACTYSSHPPLKLQGPKGPHKDPTNLRFWRTLCCEAWIVVLTASSASR